MCRAIIGASLLLLLPLAWTFAEEIKERAVLRGHETPTERMVFSPDGKRLASAASTKERADEVKVWDVATGKELPSDKGIKDSVNSLAFSRDGKILAVACYQEIRLWHVDDGQALGIIKVRETVMALGFSRDGKTLSAVSYREIFTWTVADQKEASSCRCNPDYGPFLFLDDGKTLAIGNYQDVDFLDCASGKVKASLLDHRGTVKGLAVSPDEKTLVVASTFMHGHNSYRSEITLWDRGAAKQRSKLEGIDGHAFAVAYHEPSARFVVMLTDFSRPRSPRQLQVLDAAKGRVLAGFKEPDESILPYALSSDGALIATGCPDSTIKVRELAPADKRKK